MPNINWNRGVTRLLIVASPVLFVVFASAFSDGYEDVPIRGTVIFGAVAVGLVWIARYALAWAIRGFKQRGQRET